MLSKFISIYGWRVGFRALAVISLMVLVLALLFLKEEPGQVGMTAYGAENGGVKSTEHEKEECHLHLLGRSPAERDMRSMMLMHSMFAISALCVYTNLPSVVVEIGFSTVFATGTAVSVASLFNCLGKVVMGKVNDRFGVPCMTCLWYGVCPLAMLYFVLIRVQIVPVALVGIMLIGISAGIYSVPIPLIAGCLFREDGDYARVISLCSAASSLCTSVSSMIYHRFYDVSGTYRGALLFAAALSAASLVIALRLLHRNRNAFCEIS